MRKIRNLTGMPVICSRRKIGRLVQADLSPDLKRLQGIWVDCGLRGTRYIPSEQLSMIGEKSVMADSCGQRRRCCTRTMLYRAVSTDGGRLGAVVGAEVDEISFLVCALELSRGLWDDLFPGRLRSEGFSVQGPVVIIMDSAKQHEREDEA